MMSDVARPDDGQTWDVFIYADEPVARSTNEFLVDDAAVRDLLGRRAADVVVRQQGATLQRLSIARVLPAPVVVVRRLVRTYATQFPGDSRYRLFHLGAAPTLATLGPIITELFGQRGRSERVLAMYVERTLPLGVIADALGRAGRRGDAVGPSQHDRRLGRRDRGTPDARDTWWCDDARGRRPA